MNSGYPSMDTDRGPGGLGQRLPIPWHVYLLVGFIAVLIVTMMVYSLRIGNRTATKYTPLVDATMEIQYETVLAHLWFEEIISGDRHEDISAVWKHLDTAQEYARAMLEGGQSPRGRIIALEDVQLRQEITDVRNEIEEFRRIAEQRYANLQIAGAGTEIDQRFDAVFEEFLKQADDVKTRLQNTMAAGLTRFRRLQAGLIVGTVVLAVLVGFVLHTFERRRARDFLAVQSEKQKVVGLSRFPSENPAPVLRVRADGHILYSNDAGKALLDSWETQVGKASPERWRTLIEDAFTSGESGLVEEQIGERLFSLAIVPVTDAGYANLYGRDITERKKAERQLRQYRGELEQMVDRRTKELTAVNKELEAFAYSVSHDLRAPLRGIDGFSKAFLEDYGDQVDEKGKDYLNRVRAASQRMGQLIEDLLKLSRLTRSEMRYKRVDLSAMARNIAADLGENEPDRDVEFAISEGIEVTGDETLLRAVMENLIGNAWKFTSCHEHGRIELGIEDQNGEKVFYVRDDGAGFDMTYVDKLFGAFQRLHPQTDFAGTGIGLATVQRVINRHGGHIWAQGSVEEGATFYFTL